MPAPARPASIPIGVGTDILIDVRSDIPEVFSGMRQSETTSEKGHRLFATEGTRQWSKRS
jgi:hypothetical protein